MEIKLFRNSVTGAEIHTVINILRACKINYSMVVWNHYIIVFEGKSSLPQNNISLSMFHPRLDGTIVLVFKTTQHQLSDATTCKTGMLSAKCLPFSAC